MNNDLELTENGLILTSKDSSKAGIFDVSGFSRFETIEELNKYISDKVFEYTEESCEKAIKTIKFENDKKVKELKILIDNIEKGVYSPQPFIR